MSTTTVQMNVRMPAELKAQGDAALASEGVSPSMAVRAVWEKAARRGADLAEVMHLLRSKDAAEEKVQVGAINPFEEVSQEIARRMGALGIDFSAPNEHDLSDSDLLEMAYYEKARERGVL